LGNESELTCLVFVAKTFVRERAASNAVGFVIHGSVQKKSSTEIRGKTSQKKNSSLIAKATAQVFLQCRQAIQWWRLERPLQADSSFQSPQAAELWELDLSQE
jgi:hypothetical protein